MRNDKFGEYTYIIDKVIGLYSFPKNDYDDIKQIALIGLWKGLETYKDDKNASLETYSITCVKNEIGKHMRHQKVQRRINKAGEDLSLDYTLNEDGDTFGDFLASDYDLAKEVEDRIELEHIKEIIKTLPTKDRQVIEMYYFKEMNLREIGRIMGFSGTTSKRILLTATRTIRSKLGLVNSHKNFNNYDLQRLKEWLVKKDCSRCELADELNKSEFRIETMLAKLRKGNVYG